MPLKNNQRAERVNWSKRMIKMKPKEGPGKWPVKMPLLSYLQVYNMKVFLLSHLMDGPTVQSGPCHV